MSWQDMDRWFYGGNKGFDPDAGLKQTGGQDEIVPIGHEPYQAGHLVGKTALVEDLVVGLENQWESGEILSPQQAYLLWQHEDLLDYDEYPTS